MSKTRKRNNENVTSPYNQMPNRKRRKSSENLGGHQAKLNPRGKLYSPEEPDISSILKIPGTGQAEELDEFDLPLHSTAVSAYEDQEVGKDQFSEPDESTSNPFDAEPEKNNAIRRKNQHTLKSRVEREDSEEEPVKENMRATDSTSIVEDRRLPSALSLRNSPSDYRTLDKITDLVKTLNTDKMPGTSANCHVQQEMSSLVTEVDYPDSDADGPHSVKVWGPKGMKKVARHITESDVILDECEKITAKYKQGVESKICRQAIDSFYTGFRDHLTKTVAVAEELKNTKLKNTKMIRTTNKKRQRLIEVKEELIRTEPHLKKLQREYAELKKKISSLRNAVRLVTDLKDLQQKYVHDRKENPQEEEKYGISSLPALLVESRRILGSKSDFPDINSKLQHILDFQ